MEGTHDAADSWSRRRCLDCVEDGWEGPYETTKAGAKITKPKARWTTDEKNLSKFNARALNAIFSAVNKDEFKLVCGCESAKQV